MVDGNIDPRSVEAMEKFKNYAKEATTSMKDLQGQMDKFTNSMAMTKTHATDLKDSFKQVSNNQPTQQTNTTNTRRPATTAAEQSNVTINLKIDVGGVTDRSDKKALAKEIGEMVSKELKSRMGGSLTQSGFYRGG